MPRRWVLIDGYYQFDIGTEGVPVKVSILGRLMEGSAPYGGDSVDVYAYNWGGSSWDHISPPGSGDFVGGSSSTDVVKTMTLLTAHVGTAANDGRVRIRVEGTNLESGTELYIDQIIVRYANPLTVTGIWGASDAVAIQSNTLQANTRALVMQSQVSDIHSLLVALSDNISNVYSAVNDITVSLDASDIDAIASVSGPKKSELPTKP